MSTVAGLLRAAKIVEGEIALRGPGETTRVLLRLAQDFKAEASEEVTERRPMGICRSCAAMNTDGEG